MNIKQLDEHCRLNNLSLYKRKVRQFQIRGHQWLLGRKDQYYVGK